MKRQKAEYIGEAFTGTTTKIQPKYVDVMFPGLQIVYAEDGSAGFRLPTVEIEDPRLPVISDELRKWSNEQDISENVYGMAYEAAKQAFFDTITKSSLMEELQKSMRLDKSN